MPCAEVAWHKSMEEEGEEEREQRRQWVKEEVLRTARELFVSGEITEARRRVHEEILERAREAGVEQEDAEAEVVNRTIQLSLDREERCREMAAELIAASEVSERGARLGFERLLRSVEDIKLDVPDSPAQLALFLARACVDRVVMPNGIAQEGIPNALAGEIVGTAWEILKHKHGPERVHLAWGGEHCSKVEVAKTRISAALKEYLVSWDAAEVERILRDLSMPHFMHEAVKQALEMMIELPEREPALMALLRRLSSSATINASQMAKGFSVVATRLRDLKVDFPDATEQFERIARECSALHMLPASESSWGTVRTTASGSFVRLGSTNDLASLAKLDRRVGLDEEGERGGELGARGHDLSSLASSATRRLGEAFRAGWSGLRHQYVENELLQSRSASRRLQRSRSMPNLGIPHDESLIREEARVRNYQPFNEAYQLDEALGAGGYAIVRKGRHRGTGKEVAVKVIGVGQCDQEPEKPGEGKMTREEIANELSLMNRLSAHPNIVHVHEYFLERNACLVVMDILEGPELLRALSDCRSYSENHVRWTMKPLLEAVAFMHSLGVCHRDLKAENLTLRSRNYLSSVTIVDFGLAKAFKARERMEEVCGTPWYAAPELVKEKPYTYKVDVWVRFRILCARARVCGFGVGV